MDPPYLSLLAALAEPALHSAVVGRLSTVDVSQELIQCRVVHRNYYSPRTTSDPELRLLAVVDVFWVFSVVEDFSLDLHHTNPFTALAHVDRDVRSGAADRRFDPQLHPARVRPQQLVHRTDRVFQISDLVCALWEPRLDSPVPASVPVQD